MPAVTTPLARNVPAVPSCAISAVASGSTNVAPNAVRIRPRTLMTPSTRRSPRLRAPRAGSSCRPREQALDGIHVTPVREEQDHVVIGLHHGVMVAHDHLIAA